MTTENSTSKRGRKPASETAVDSINTPCIVPVCHKVSTREKPFNADEWGYCSGCAENEVQLFILQYMLGRRSTVDTKEKYTILWRGATNLALYQQ